MAEKKFLDLVGLQKFSGALKNGTLVVGKAAEANKVKSTNIEGTIPLENLPQGALERMVVVADDAARFALTTVQVQQGDTVKVESSGLMYYVVDDTKLGMADGYEDYKAGYAAKAAEADHAKEADKVAWEKVTDKPSSFTPSAHTQGSDTITSMTGYQKASSAAAVSASDSLNAAIGKIEKKMDDITAQGGEPNVLEGVKVNGKALSIGADKTVDIPEAGQTVQGVTRLYNDLSTNGTKTDGAVTPAAVKTELDAKVNVSDIVSITDAEIEALFA